MSNFEWRWLAKPSCDIYIAGGACGVSGHVTYTYRAERAGAGGVGGRSLGVFLYTYMAPHIYIYVYTYMYINIVPLPSIGERRSGTTLAANFQ